ARCANSRWATGALTLTSSVCMPSRSCRERRTSAPCAAYPRTLSGLGAAEEELGAIAGLQTGTIHLGASTAPGVYLLPDTLGCFRRSYPGVTVDVEVAASGEILKRLLAGRVQLALVGATRAEGQGGREIGRAS